MTSPTTLEEANAELTLRLRQQELTAAFATFGLRTDELQPVLQEACRIAAKGMECSFAKVLRYLPEESHFLVQAGVGWRPGVVGQAKLGTDLASPAGFAFHTAQPVISNHLRGETRFRTPDLLIEHGIHRALNVLIQTAPSRYGVLEVDSPDGRDFSVSDIAFLQSLAATLASAIAKQERIAALRRSERFIDIVLDASTDCVKVLDRAGTLQMMNANGLRALEFDTFNQVAGKLWVDLWPEGERSKVLAALDAARSGTFARFEAFCPTAKGTPKWWDVLVTPIGSADGRLLSVSRDISERVAASETKDLLMLEIHHRVKNSLQLVHNLLSLQSRATDNEQASDQLRESAARIRTIAAIHDRLYKTGSASTVDVRPYLEGLVEDLSEGLAAGLDGRTIRIKAQDSVWPAGDVPTLGLVLTELVTNALKYGEGTIHVEFSQPAGTNGTLTVWDDGPGLPEDFDPASSRGLGMRLINGLLRGEGAGLTIDRSQGHTRFVARLPAIRPPS